MPDESATRQNRRTIQRSVAAAKQFERVETICRYSKAKRYGVGAGNYTDFFAGSNPVALANLPEARLRRWRNNSYNIAMVWKRLRTIPDLLGEDGKTDL